MTNREWYWFCSRAKEWTGDICRCIVGADSMILICEGKFVISSLLFLNSDGIYW